MENVESIYPLGPMQETILLQELGAGATGGYVEQVSWTVLGPFDAAAFARAWERAVRRHPALRSVFFWDGLDAPVQVVRRRAEPRAETLDWRGVDPREQEARLAELREAHRREGFDVSAAPPLRLARVRTGEEEHRFVWSYHHLVLDGWSATLLLREVLAAYGALCRGEEPAEEPVPSPAAYHAWLRGRNADAEAFWRAELAGLDAPARLPGPRGGEGAGGRGAARALTLDPALAGGLRAAARRHRVTLQTVLQGAWAVLQARYAGEGDVVLGVLGTGRPAGVPGAEAMLGLFVNAFPVRVRVGAGERLGAWLRGLQAAHARAREWEHVAPARVRGWSGLPGGGRLFDTLFVFQDLPDAGFDGARVGGQEVRGFRRHGSDDPLGYAALLEAGSAEEGLELALRWDEGLADGALLAGALGHLGTILAAMAAPGDPRVDEIQLLDAAGRARVLEQGSATAEFLPEDTLHRRFAVQAARTPDSVAVTAGGESLTYGELERRSARLAAALRRRGVRAEVRVALWAERSADLVVAILGVLGAGGAYVPVDPRQPAGRAAHLLEDSGCALVLAQDRARALLPPVRVEVLSLEALAAGGADEQAPVADVLPQNAAYVVYTSGSTGRPKGVVVTHASVLRLFDATQEWFGFGGEDVWTLFHSPAFDFSVWETWGGLLHGGRLVVVPFAATRSPEELRALLERERVTVLSQTPSAFRQLSAVEETRGAAGGLALRRVVFGGEALELRALRGWMERHGEDAPLLVNMYGITETTVHVTFRPIRRADVEAAEGSPLGRAIPDLSLRVLDGWGNPVPVGVAGELYVGGPGVARGYLGRPELTAERFVPDAFGSGPGARLYRSGDRVRWLPAGELEYLGRTDHQVKVRGYRIEPGEIEAALLEGGGLREAVVLARDEAPGEKRLVAYVVPGPGEEVTPAALRERLRDRLPEYMVPAAFVVLERFPLDASGKTDRRALPAPRWGGEAAYEAPRTATEELLCGIWEEVLGTERVGTGDGFFDLGGHSLLVMRVVSRARQAFGVELPVRAIFEAPTPAGLAARIDALREEGRAAAPAIRRAPRGGAPLPASFAQQRLWLVDRIEPGSPAYNMPVALRLRGPLDARALGRSLDALTERHETLRTTFAERGGEPVQVIHAAAPVALPVVEVADEAEAARLAVEEALRPFDLAAGPLLRCTLLRLDAEDHVALFTLHHVVGDGWSMDVLVREVSALYRAFSRGEEPALPELPVQYADFAVWQRGRLGGGALDRQVGWWRERLAGAPPVLEVATDRPRATGRGAAAGEHAFALSPELSAELRALSRREGATLFMTVLAGWQVLLGRWSGQDDVVVGTPVAGRTRSELEGLIGFFVNMLALRADLAGDPSWRGVLGRVREGALGAYAHQEVPFERLVEALAAGRSLAHTPLFQAAFGLERSRGPDGMPSLAGVRTEPFGTGAATARFDLDLTMAEEDGVLGGVLVYRAELWEPGTIARMAAGLEATLAAMAADPERRLSQLSLLGESERAQLLRAWQGAPAAYPAAPVHRLVAEQVARTPDAPAVVHGGRSLTYAALQREAGRVAGALRARDVGPGSLVAVCLERSAELAVALLGVLRAGAAFVPLDPAYPRERLARLLDGSGARAVLTAAGPAGALPADGPERILFEVDFAPGSGGAADAGADVDLDLDHLAYVIYTSGSTGAPKGVMLSHRSLVCYADAMRAHLALGPADRVLQFASPAFDVMVEEVFPALLAGACVVFPEGGLLGSPGELHRVLRAERISVVELPTAFWHEWVRSLAEEGTALPEDLRLVLMGGERVLPGRVADWARLGVPLVHVFGLTETAVTSATLRLEPGDDGSRWANLPVGRALPNVRLYVLDGERQPVPEGVVGELYVGGDGVARGYLGRPGLTAGRFVPDPYGEPGTRLYRTGDRVRRLSDGNLEFLGRMDQQAKVRGFRIEPAEIEAALAEHPAVREAVVVVREDAPGEKRLVGYVVPAPRGRDGGLHLSPEELRRHLRERLPEHMVPPVLVPLDELPLTPNGKTDRRALPDPGPGSRETEHVGSRTATEELLAGIWADVLGTERVGVREGFFELGGHSLLAMRVVSRVRQALGVELPLRALFEAPTVESLAGRVDDLRRAGSAAAPPIVPVPREGPVRASFAQQRLWLVDRMEPGSPAYNMPHALRLRGPLDVRALRRSLDALVARHETLRTTFAERGGEPVQVVHAAAPVALGVVEVADEAEAARLAGEEALRPFDLAAGPLLRCTLLRLDAEDHVVLFTLHHVAGDGWSMDVLVREVSALYGAFSRGGEPALPELPVQYADFAAWQRAWLAGDVLAAQVEWWRERLAGAPPLLEVPTDRPRAAGQGGPAGRVPLALSPELARGLRALGRREGATLFMTVLAGWQALLGRYAGQEDVVVGTPVAGRTRAELEGLIGFFVNMLALRADLGGDPSWAGLLARVREAALGAYAHQELPFERLVEEVATERSLTHAPLFQAGFSLERALPGDQRLSLGPVEAASFGGGTGIARSDLDLVMTDDGESLGGGLEYRTTLWEAGSAARMAGHLELLLEAMAADPAGRVSAVPLLRGAERAQLLEAWQGPRAAFPRVPVHRLVAEQALRAPGAAAVADGGRVLGYGELDREADRVARALRARGVGPETRVAVCLERSAGLVVALLGVLRAGGAYVPLDPGYPRERLAWLLADSGARVVLTRGGLAGLLPGNGPDRVLLDAPDVPGRAGASVGGADIDPDQLAYVVYTSGSTGTPRGVMVSHASLAHMVAWHVEAFGVGSADRATLAASPAFDASVMEIWPFLARGASLHPVPEEARLQPEALRDWVLQRGITIATLSTPLAEGLMGVEWPREAPLRALLCGGDVLRARPRPALPFALVNCYGPTEGTVNTAVGEVSPAGDSLPSLGRPIARVRAHVLDAGMEPVPVGVSGELYIGGAGVARGYAGRPGATAERFVPDPFGGEPGARLYRSGDRVRWLAGGELAFLGRTDQQVKVRGFRVELGEVEAALLAHPSVGAAAAAVREAGAGEKRLVGYVVAREAEVAGPAVRGWLRERLPEHMVPSAVVVLDELPLTRNGKLDRRALPAPLWEGGAGYVAPRTPAEEVLDGIWAAVLGRERVGAEAHFFEAGGHSLLAAQVVARVREAFRVELPLRAVFEAPTLAGLAGRIEALGREGSVDDAPPVGRVPRDGRPLPASFAQRRLWLVDRMEPGSPAYNMPVALRLRGALEVRALRRSLDALAARHETLRTTLEERGGEPVQVIGPAIPAALPTVDLGGLPEAARGPVAERLAAEEAARPFDLAAGPLLRCTLLRLDAEDHVALFTLHHVVSDGWSMGVLVREISALYAAFSRDGEPALPELPVQYADFAAWQRARLYGERLEAQVGWWRERLAGAPPLLEIPTDRRRAAGMPAGGGVHRFTLPSGVSDGLRALGRRAGATLFMTVLAGWQALLGRYAGQEDVVVGTPVAGRTRTELEGLIGFFVNMLALRADLSGDPSWAGLLGRVRETALEAYAHQEVPFEHLVEELATERSPAHAPLFQVTFALERALSARGALSLGGVALEAFGAGAAVAKFDLDLTVHDDGGALRAEMGYRTALWEPATIAAMASRLEVMLEAMAAGPDARVSEAPLLRGAERARVLEAWSGTAAGLPGEAIHELFAGQAGRTPGAAAVLAGGESLAYGELERGANRLAHLLRERGVGPETRVGVCMERGIPVIVALLGILKAGGAYVPLDPGNPPERLREVFADAGVALVLTHAPAGARLPAGIEPLRLDDPGTALALAAMPDSPPPVPADARQLAYVVYTSGSTGRPKGVAVSHGAVVRLVRGTDYLPFGPAERIAQVSTLAFDAATFEVWGALLNGGALVVLERDATLSPAAFAAGLRERRVTAVFVTTALFNRVARDEPGAFGSVRHVLFGGEAADPRSVRRVLEAGGPGRLLHVYGPTETTTFASWHPVRRVEPGAVTVPIGGPLANTTLYVLDARGEPVPPGLPGELFIGGAGVARGYLGRPATTAERFVPDPFGAAGGRLYRTGDRVRWLPAGALEFLGRMDAQAKVRGFRIEPGEVEAALLEHGRVREALVAVREDEPGEKRLVAYVVAAGGAEVAAPELREHLRGRLPEYMVPSAYVVLEALPLTANGKVDRRALPAPERGGSEGAYVAPRTAAEEVLAGIWAETLRLETVGAEDDFFELGGHSLLAAQVVSRVRAALGVELPLRSVFEAPTVAALARCVETLRGAGPASAPPVEPVPRDLLRPPPASFAQRRLWFIQQMEPESAAYNIPSVLRLHGRLDPRAMAGALADLAARHETLRTVFATTDGEPVQVVRPAAPRPLPVLDLRALPAEERAAEVRRLARAEAGLPFDLARGPLMRAGLLRADGEEWVLLLTLHHVASDGWSTGILLRETSALYEARLGGADAALPPLPVQYADFAVWQRAWLAGEVLDRQLAFWRAELAGAPPVLDLPTDRPRPAVQGSREGVRALALPASTSRALRALSRREGATLFMTLLGAWQLLLARWAAEDDVSVGSPVAGRTRLETEGLIGFFVNMLVLRTELRTEASFTELLRGVRETTLGAYAHQDVPFEKLVEELAPQRSLTHTPLFQATFSLRSRERAAPWSGSLRMEAMGEEGGAAKYDLALDLEESGDALAGTISYRRELFDAATVERMAEHFATLAAAVAADPDRPLAAIPMLGEAERHRLVEEWNATERPFPGGLRIHQAFEAQAARTPEATALVFGGEEVTYAELDRRAERLARALRRRGVAAETRVGVCVERSAGMVAALLGVLKAGGAYVPLDPSYPRERLAYMVRDSGLAVAVAGERQRALLPEGVEVICVDGDGVNDDAAGEDALSHSRTFALSHSPFPENLAYVIYTSGSTGTPKGVGVTHRNALSFFAAMDERVGGEGGTWMAVTSISFDISVLELLWTLARGFRVVVHPDGAAAPARRSARPVDFSLFYFASAGGGADDGYRLLMEGARFADRNGFAAVWTPERHFHDFGGLYPNPSVTGAAVAAVTERVGIRAGSVVLPLHSPVRVAEEWAVVDVLSRGRVGISFASGWHADDFVLAPASYADRREVMLRGIEEVRGLWRGDAVRMVGGTGDEVEVRTLPRPVQAELPVWITSSGTPETFRTAGERGYNVLTHLLGQSTEELAGKVALYRDSLRRHGHDPDGGRVALMLHAFVGESEEAVREAVREPFKRYLASSVGLIRGLARSMGTTDLDALAPEDMDALLEHAFERYFGSAGLMGTAEQCLATVERLREAGVDELACLVDFGVETEAALAALERLDEVRRRAAEPAPEGGDDATLAAELLRHGATHLQCTPSTLRTLLPDRDAPRALGGLRKLLLGGEALPAPLAAEALAMGVGELHNMYGPTETTVWSATHRVASAEGGIALGAPVANTRIHLVDRAMEPVPVGVRGELLIGGEGVARGYLGRPELTAERFVPDPFARHGTAGARLYRTGDLARRRADGLLEVVGRADQQVKVRGHRVEPGEVEAALEAHPAVAEAAVAAREDAPGERRLVAYLAAPPAATVPSPAELRGWLRQRLPEYMVPSAFVAMDRLPRTPGGKLDRRSLPAPDAAGRGEKRALAPPRTPVEAALAATWAEVLRVERVGVHDNFFESGGDSILAIQVVARAARAGVRVTPRQLFQHQTVAELAAVAGSAAATAAEQGPVVGAVPLTPIQSWLLEQGLPDPHHYNQAVLLAPREALDAALLARAVAALAVHHDALRLRFTRGAEGWSQESGPAGGRAPFSVLDLAGVRAEALGARIEEAAAALQAGLDPARGPVFRVGLMERGAGEPQRLMIVVHHLAVDGVSWRVLLEDLESACRQLRAGGPVRFPPKTTSFREWAERLAGYARSEKLAAEVPYWTDPRRLDAVPVPVDRDGPNPESGTGTVTVGLTADETRALLHDAPAAYRTRVDDFLLAALARALAAWTGGRRVLVNLEGHGREELFSGVDLSRTVGWFTSLVPVLLETDPAHGPAEALKSVKEQLRAVPERGVGHGVLRWLHPDAAVRGRLAAAPAPDVLFNYLGQLDGTVGEDTLFRPAGESRGPDRGPRGPRGHLVEVTGMVFGGELRMDWMYGREVHDRATVERVAERFAAELRSLVAHCREPGAGGVTPSDFPLAGLTQEELDARLGSGLGVEDVYPVTPMQEGLLFESLYAPGTGIYVGQLVAELRGELDPEALERAWRSAAARHEVLRAGFRWEGLRRPLQVVRREARVPFRREDLRGAGAEDPEARLARYLEEDRREGFDLAEAPLTRVALFRTGEREHRMVWTHHHLVLDGWSLPVLLRDVLELYHAHRRGERAGPGGAPPYREFVSWLAARDLGRAEEFWRAALAGLAAPTPLPGGGRVGGAAGQAEVKRELGAALTGALREQARRVGVTLGTLVQGAWALLLSRWVGEEEVVFGTTVAGRPAELRGVEEMVGLFINTLPVRVRVEGAATLREWLRRLQAEQVEAREHEYAPLAEVQRWSGVPPGEPLFESLVAFENYPVGTAAGDGAEELRVSVSRSIQENGFPLVLAAIPGDRLALELRHDAGRVAPETARELARHLETVLEGVAGDPGTRLARISLLGDDERAGVLEAGRGGARPYAREALVHDLVAARAAAAPDLPAVACGARVLTYGELDASSARLASRLRAAGAGPEVPVAVFLDRSAELGVALLAVLRAGGAFLPLDVAYPRERLEYLLEDSGARVVVTRSDLAGRLPAGTAGVLCVDDGAPGPVDAGEVARVGPDALAYLIYTSGSTGRPKAVMVSHRSLVCFIEGIRERIGYTPADRVLQFASPAFDVMIEEVFPAWASGACVVFPEGEAPGSPRELQRVLEDQRVTIAELPTAFWHEWVRQTVEDGGALPETLRLVAMGSERVLPERLAQWARLGKPLLHGYGLTEATVATTTVLLPAGEDGSRWPSVPIGVPLPNAEAHVLDSGGEPVPAGVPGELYLGGEVVARGYRGHPALTAERWVPHPFADAPGARLCRTGDRARRLPDGNLEFLGRIDGQAKIRGFRIEPGEVEAVLGAHPAVGEAVVVVREDARGEKILVGYVSAGAGTEVAGEELRAWLRERLPEHMVPGAIVALERLPLTPGGKVDRRALPAPEWTGGAEYLAPRTATEEVLAGIWAETLGLERVGVEASFFALGGHSLLAMQAVSRVRRALGVELPLRTLFDEPTVAALARRVDALRLAGAASELPLLVPVRARGERRPLFLVHPVGGGVMAYAALAARLHPEQPVFALRSRGTEPGEEPRGTVEEMARDYLAAVRGEQPAGPYRLGGWSMGGVVAFEMARQLEAAGEEVEALVLIDSRLPRLAAPGRAGARDGLLLVQAFAQDLGIPADRLPAPDADAGEAAYLGRVLRSARAAGLLPGDLDPARMQQLYGVFRFNLRAMHGYRPGSYGGRVTLLRVGERGLAERLLGKRAAGWRRVARGELEVRTVPGTHHTMLREPQVETLAGEVERALG
jgi:natural product biosynthesis luciferase-like monooxygenase protein/amino acid adenylation domain-containing protein/non-ribosomal peptide synthase protein (TIGR01720 family)